MSQLPPSARLLILLLAALALVAVLSAAATPDANVVLWGVVAIVAVVVALLDAFPISLAPNLEVTVSDTVKFAVVLLFPVPVVILGIFLGTLLAEMRVDRPWFKKIFNISEMVLIWAGAAWVYQAFHQPEVNYFGSLQNILVLIVTGLTAFLLNSILLSWVISLAAHLSFRFIWSRNIPQVIWQDFSMLSLGVFLAVLWNYNPLTVILAVLPLFIIRHSYQMAVHLQAQTRDALIALMQVIDERDQHTSAHSERVSSYARSMAQALDLPEEEIEVIASAALLHDLGKVGMADDILFKDKRLTPSERASAERHAEIGAMLLNKFPLFQKGADLVRHHHEHYDGNGYPDHLKGDAIPMGARIIAIADAYQAMTEERPYRRAMGQDVAIAELQRCSGAQFDPSLVTAFIEILRANSTPEHLLATPVPLQAD